MANTKKTGVRIIAFTIAAGMVLGTVSAPAFADEIVAVTEDGQIAIEEPLQEYQDVEADQDEYLTVDEHQQVLPENEEEEAIPQEDLEEEDTGEDSAEVCTEDCTENEMALESDSEEALPAADEENDQLHSEESDPDDVRYAEGFWGEWEYYEEYTASRYGDCFCGHLPCEPDEEEVQEEGAYKEQMVAYEKSLAGHDLDEAEDAEDDYNIDDNEDDEDEEDYDDEYDEDSDDEEEESDSDDGWWKILEMKEERLDFTR